MSTLPADRCQAHVGAPVKRVLFRSGFLSEVIGVELSGGLRAVVKARPFEPRIVGCVQVQAALAEAGFPCPKPLTGATRVADMTVTAESEVSGGSPRPVEAGVSPLCGAPRPAHSLGASSDGGGQSEAFTPVGRTGPRGTTAVGRPR